MVIRSASAAVVAASLALAAAAPAGAAGGYHSPGYEGTTKAPKTVAPPPPTPVRLGTGKAPQVLVDAAGTAHVTWSEDRGDAADVVRYCRLKRGAKACDATHDLVPVQTGDALVEDRFNIEEGTPRVLAIGDQLIVLTQRYPNSLIGPDGQSHDRNTYLFASDDGGAAFQPPALVGTGPTSGQPTVFGPPDTPRIGLISDTMTGGTFIQVISGARYSATTGNLGADGVSSSLAPDGLSLLAAFQEFGDTIHVRRWNGLGDPQDPAQWSDATLPGTDPLLAGGPAGDFLLSRDRDRQLALRRVSGGRPGARAVVPDTKDASLRDVFQDPSGRVLVSYRETTTDGDLLQLRSSTDGRTFSAPQTMLRIPTVTGFSAGDMGAAADGGGFVVAQEGSGGAEGPIVALPFGTQAANHQAGLGGVPGSGLPPDVVSNCQQLKFGQVSIRTTEGCLLGTAKDKAVKVAEGVLRLNGLEIVPEGGAKIVLDARARTLDTTGTVRVQMRAPGIAPVVLFRGALHIRLAAEAQGARAAQAGDCSGQQLANFDADTDLLGFPIKGSIAVHLSGESSCVPVSLELPKAFGGVRGNAILRADNARGLHVDSLHIGVDQAFIGPLLLEDLAIDYQAAGDEWGGGATLGLPPQPGGAKLGAKVRFAGGAFKEGSLELTFPFPGIALDPFAVSYLRRVDGGFGLEPLYVEAGATIGVLPVPPSEYTFEVDGKLRVTFAAPVTFAFDGSGKFFGFPVATEHLLLTTDGLVKADGQVGIDLDAVSVKGGLDAFVDLSDKRFGGKVSGEVCFTLGCVDGSAVISTRGFGACTPIAGFGYHWGASPLSVDVMLIKCDLSDYVEPEARAAQAGGGRAFTVAKGQSVVNVRLTGAGGAPAVVLVSPSGDRIAPSANPADRNAPAVSMAVGARTYVGLRDPAPGRWTVEPADGSPAIASLAVAHAISPPDASARLGGKGRRRTLRYTVSTGGGLRTTFVERSAAGQRVLGTARGRRGTLRFAPGPGPRRRTIVAVVERDGIPRLEKTVARYTAPRPARPGRVRGLHVKRRGPTLKVRWRRDSGARTYAVRIDLPDGRRLLRVLRARQTRLRLGGIPRHGRVNVTVAARDASGRSGPGARGRA